MTPLLRVRQVVNVVNLSTPLGLVVALVGGGRPGRGPHGLVLAENYRSAFPGGAARAVTIGNVVLLRMSRAEAEALPGLIAHESRHATQYACCIGPFGFLPAYFIACAWSWWHTGNVALRNVFEVRAGLADGGYVQDPRRRGPQGV
ncbi:MAG: hypothetical protein U0Q19_13500 [Kineosporiaceae bacterium]